MYFTLSYLDSLRHTNGRPIVQIHSPVHPLSKSRSEPGRLASDLKPYSPQTHGAIISLSVLNSSGERVPPHRVEREAGRSGIHIRAGCMCNPGASAELLGLSTEFSKFKFEEPYRSDGYSKSSYNDERDSPHAVHRTYSNSTNQNLQRLIEEEGVVRVSFGLASTLKDAWKFIQFVKKFTKEQESGTYLDAVGALASGSTACSDFGKDKQKGRRSIPEQGVLHRDMPNTG